MNFKKAISAFAALAISVSCFAGLTVANASTTVDLGTVDLTSVTTPTDDYKPGMANNETEGDRTYDVFSNKSNSKNYKTAYFEITSGGTAAPITSTGIIEVSFDFKASIGNQNSTGSYIVLNSELTKADAAPDASKSLMQLKMENWSTGKLTINGTSFEDIVPKGGTQAKTGWWHYNIFDWSNVDAYINFATRKIDVTVTHGSDTKSFTVDIPEENTSNQLAGFELNVCGGLDAMGISNFTVKKIVSPVYTLKSNDNTVNEGDMLAVDTNGSITLNFTEGSGITNADAISVVSSNSNSATITDKTYDATTGTGSFKINGTANKGISEITVTATSDDNIVKTIKFRANVGNVTTHKVTVKYVIDGEEETQIATANTSEFTSAIQDDIIVENDVPHEATLWDNAETKGIRYTYKEMNTPFTVPDNDNGVILVKYTKQPKVTALNLNQKENTTTLGTVAYTETELKDKYIGDEVSKYINKAFTDANGKVKAYTDETSFLKAVTLTNENVVSGIDVPYTSIEDDEWLIEAESVAALTDGNDKGQVGTASGLVSGGAGRRPGAGAVYCTVPASGIYEITVRAGATNGKTVGATLYKGTSAEGTVIGSVSGGSGNVADKQLANGETKQFSLNKGESIFLADTSANVGNTYIDYILFKKVGDFDPVLVNTTETKPDVETTFDVAASTFDTFANGNPFYTAKVEKVVSIPVKYASEANLPELYIHGEKVALTKSDWTCDYNAATEVGTYYIKFVAPTTEGLKQLDDAYIVCGVEETAGDNSNRFALKTLLDSDKLSNELLP